MLYDSDIDVFEKFQFQRFTAVEQVEIVWNNNLWEWVWLGCIPDNKKLS